jgi:hypothetical protein
MDSGIDHWFLSLVGPFYDIQHGRGNVPEHILCRIFRRISDDLSVYFGAAGRNQPSLLHSHPRLSPATGEGLKNDAASEPVLDQYAEECV